MEIHYRDPSPESKMNFERMNFFMFVDNLPPESEESYMISDFAIDVYGFNKRKFKPKSFHLHHPTEHPFNGGDLSIEMHVNHYTADNSNGLVEGKNLEMFTHSFWFSVSDYHKDISVEDA